MNKIDSWKSKRVEFEMFGSERFELVLLWHWLTHVAGRVILIAFLD